MKKIIDVIVVFLLFAIICVSIILFNVPKVSYIETNPEVVIKENAETIEVAPIDIKFEGKLYKITVLVKYKETTPISEVGQDVDKLISLAKTSGKIEDMKARDFKICDGEKVE